MTLVSKNSKPLLYALEFGHANIRIDAQFIPANGRTILDLQ